MPYPDKQDTGGRRWQPAPTQMCGGRTTSAVLGVWLNPGEQVRWTWGADGQSIVGYTIIPPGNIDEETDE